MLVFEGRCEDARFCRAFLKEIVASKGDCRLTERESELKRCVKIQFSAYISQEINETVVSNGLVDQHMSPH